LSILISKKKIIMPTFKLDLQFFAQKKGGGSASTNRSHKSYNPSNLGVKKFGGEFVKDGEIIIRQLGSKFLVGPGAYFGRDYTIHAGKEGKVKFLKIKRRRRIRTLVSVLPLSKLE